MDSDIEFLNRVQLKETIRQLRSEIRLARDISEIRRFDLAKLFRLLPEGYPSARR